jgi:hypothetical protein
MVNQGLSIKNINKPEVAMARKDTARAIAANLRNM